MASWYYAYNSEQRGPVDEDEFRMLQQTGVVKASTLVWQEGMAEWLTLAEVQGRPRPSSTANAVPSPASGGQAPSALGQTVAPSGTFTTPSAGSPPPGNALPPYGQAPVPSPYDPSPYVGAITVDERNGPAWEEPYKSFFGRLWETLKANIIEPMNFFGTMRREGDYVAPTTYMVVTALIGTVVSLAWQAPLQMAMMAMEGNKSGNAGAAVFGGVLGLGIGLVCAVILVPVFWIVIAFVTAAINHVLLMLFGGANGSFESSYRVIAYTMGTWSMLNTIPLVGCISWIWFLVMTIIGLAKLHETDTWRSACAVLVPFFVCCIATVALYGVMFAALMGAMGQGAGAGTSPW